MKKSLRFASAALALTLAAGCAMPAFAAGKSSFSKSETVYAVMNGDGSIKSTTVSEHLYSASGLANVTDKTTLTDIQNTESDAEFTQNGEELVWNTNDTDVYYKGNTDKALPIDVKVTYALDGQEAALSSIVYTPEYSLQVMRHLYDMGDKVFGPYGFYDAFSETDNWYPQRYLAIDQGPIAVMIENYRSGLLWKLFMSHPDVQQGLRKLGFQLSSDTPISAS